LSRPAVGPTQPQIQ